MTLPASAACGCAAAPRRAPSSSPTICEAAPEWLPNRANVSFVRVLGPEAIFVRTFERGVGLTDYAANNTGTVGVYIDEVNHPYAVTFQGSLFDIDRVEVLRGPQGTLFGEGSMGGTVRILTKGADLDNWEAKASGFVSDTDGGATNGGIKGAFNAPIIPGILAVRVAGTHERFNGWVDNRAAGTRNLNDQRFDTFRAKLRFDPTDRLSITGLAADRTPARDDNGPPVKQELA